MIGQPAKVLRPGDVRHALAWAIRRRHGLRNQVMILLSVKAGLRAAEIAGLTWEMVTDSAGSIGAMIELPASRANGDRDGVSRCTRSLGRRSRPQPRV